MNEDEIQFDGGALEDIPSKKDYDAEPIMGATPSPDMPSFEEGFDLEEKYTELKQEDQGPKSWQCVGEANSYYAELLNFIETGKYINLSSKGVYSRIFIYGVGAYLRDGAKVLVNYGVPEESLVPSYKPDGTTDENWVTDTSWQSKEHILKNARKYSAKSYAKYRGQDFDFLARMIFENNGFVSGSKTHATYFKGYGIENGKRYINSKNSYGDRGDLKYFEGDPNPLFSIWTLIDEKNVIESGALFKDINYGDEGIEVIKLKNALIRLGWIEAKELGDKYDDKLAKLILNFQLANLPHSGWAFWFTLFYYKGKRVGIATRSIINNILKYK